VVEEKRTAMRRRRKGEICAMLMWETGEDKGKGAVGKFDEECIVMDILDQEGEYEPLLSFPF
jgi:hypothetical protein